MNAIRTTTADMRAAMRATPRRRTGRPRRVALVLAVLGLALLVADILLGQVSLPLTLTVTGGQGVLLVDGQRVALAHIGTPVAIEVARRDPVVVEQQLDGTDSTNNFTLDAGYLRSIATSPYYRLQAWMRDLGGTSQWHALTTAAGHHETLAAAVPTPGTRYSIPGASAGSATYIRAALQRPETPATLLVYADDGTVLHVVIDRNDRYISVTQSASAATSGVQIARLYFPSDPRPFAAMAALNVVRAALWAVLVLAAVLALDVAAGIAGVCCGIRRDLPRELARRADQRRERPRTRQASGGERVISHFSSGVLRNAIQRRWHRLTLSIYPIGLFALPVSFAFTCWVACAQYHAVPHIYDAASYLFGARILASGQLSVPLPPAADRFPGPFMIQLAGRWFSQYPPGTALFLALGLRLSVPWLIEPLMGTLALLGIGLITARLYSRRVATTAVMLGILSPFYTYLAASYMSHAVTLCLVVWGLWALLCFAQGAADRWLPFSAVCFGMAGLTRDLVTVLWTAVALAFVLLLVWRRVRWDWRRWIAPGLTFLAVVSVFFVLYLCYDIALTGSPLVTPRELFFPGDHFGFGVGVGFYGQHTVAAGLVNLDQLLTALSIDLYGWPIVFTLAIPLLPFLLGRARRVDTLLLAAAAVLTGIWIGYYYAGIYLGPRYLYESLPFLLPLTARGFWALAEAGGDVRRQAAARIRERLRAASHATDADERATRHGAGSVGTALLATGLLACALVYYWPRQIALHQDFTGMPAGHQLRSAQLLNPPLHHAIVITGNYSLYGYTLFALNDPALRGDVIYAFANTAQQYAELHTAYPDRALYLLHVTPGGNVQYRPLDAKAGN